MELAAISRSKEFIGHPRCKEISDEKWRGDILLASDDEYLNRKVCFTSCHYDVYLFCKRNIVVALTIIALII